MAPARYIICGHEMEWFIVGLVAGMVFMALVDYVIDKKGKRK
jgi:hypothetical protein